MGIKQKLMGLILMKDHVQKHEDFHKILYKIIINDLFALMDGDHDMVKLDSEKPHIKGVLNTLAYLLSYDHIKPRHAKKLLEDAWNTSADMWDIGWYIADTEMFDEIDLTSIVSDVIVQEVKAWKDYCSGMDKVIGRLVGRVMKATNGKADPEEARTLFNERKNNEIKNNS